jgi:hypothetical protein
MGGSADTYARTLARLDEPEPVRLAVAGETVRGVAASTYLGDECIRVDVAERGGDRTFRVQVHWLDGWLDPAVDVREPGDGGFEPAGRLDGVAVTTGNAASAHDSAAAAE